MTLENMIEIENYKTLDICKNMIKEVQKKYGSSIYYKVGSQTKE